MPQPDPNAKAPRPAHISSDDEARPDMDNPPPAPSTTSTGFDRGAAAADREARIGTVPGPDDFDAQQVEDPSDDDIPPDAASRP